jgi:hypothetical protein
MRDRVAFVSFFVFIAAVYFIGRLQDRMRRKAGAPLFSFLFLWRCLGTSEFYVSILLVLLLTAAAGTLIALDAANYIPK